MFEDLADLSTVPLVHPQMGIFLSEDTSHDPDLVFEIVSSVINSRAFSALSIVERLAYLFFLSRYIYRVYKSDNNKLEIFSILAFSIRKLLLTSQNNEKVHFGYFYNIYEFLRNFSCSINDYASFTAFDLYDDCISAPLARHLVDSRAQKLEIRSRQARALRVGYIMGYPNFGVGQAVTPLTATYARSHARARRELHDVFVYATSPFSPEVLDYFAGDDNVTVVTDVPRGAVMADHRKLHERILHDQIDILVTDLNTFSSTYLFVNRSAPVQAFLEMGMPFWNIPGLDHVLLVGLDAHGRFPLSKYSHSRMPWILDQKFVDRPQPVDTVASLKASFPPGKIITGTFCRLIKISPAFIDVVAEIMRQAPEYHWIIAGPGHNAYLNQALTRSPFLGRVTVYDNYVDLSLMGRAIDVFFDTFPILGATVAVEMAYHGVAVVAYTMEFYHELLMRTRDPDILSRTIPDYISNAVRLAKDPKFLAEKKTSALILGRSFTDLDRCGREAGEIFDQLAKDHNLS